MKCYHEDERNGTCLVTRYHYYHSRLRYKEMKLWILYFLLLWTPVQTLTLPARHWMNDVVTGYERRCAADPNFPLKSLTEVVLAAGTQLAAEYERRGPTRIVSEVDFVIGGVLTAMYGKYAAMWIPANSCMACR